VTQIQLSLLLSLVCVAALALGGCRPYLAELRGRTRQTVGAFLFIGVLAMVVFFPVTSFGEAEQIDPATIALPVLLAGHVVLVAYLLLWWRLRGDVSLARFLHLSADHVWDKLRRGLTVGAGGWLLTIAITGVATAAAGLSGGISEPAEIPPVMAWLATLPISSKLLIVVAAMSVEEAFFRGFLQPRVGLLMSSVMFALSHFSYGLPFMLVGVFSISLIIGLTFARGGDLLPCIVAHGVFDAVQLLVVLPLAVRLWPEPAGVTAVLATMRHLAQ
jgi:membrane protease YdiL (CAAX protease family)